MSLRRLWVLVSRLPADSRTKQAMYGEEIAAWTPEGQQRMILIHRAEVANWQRGSGKKSERPQPPEPPRPWIRIHVPDDL